MRRTPRLFHTTATVAMTALLCNTMLPLAAIAQPSPPPLPAAPPLPTPNEGRPDLNQADPPERVGRIADTTGTVSFHNPGDTQWSAASPNYPVATGNSFWTEPSARARLEISDSRIIMSGATEFDVTALNANGLQGVAAAGEIYLRLRDLAPGETWGIQTPRGEVHLGGEGRFGIVVGTTDQPTMVTVVDGAARIEGPGVSLQLAAGQTASITGSDSFQASVGPALRDAFLTACLDAERPRPAAAAPLPPQVYAMPGGSDLDGTGTWTQAPEYGQVWYPPVSPGWVPYREGHWAFVAPWGWTWIDDAPWGFAPFHYGRWIEIDGRWAWTPGEAVHERPVYAPALVTFLGIGAGVAVGAALVAGSIGWVPLGPHEPFHPWYHASSSYIRQVNVSHVTNNITTNNIYINRAAATSVPAEAMIGSRPVQSVARPVAPQELAAARPFVGQQPIRPSTATAGVTPALARQLNLGSTAPEHSAPGPAVRPAAAGTTRFAEPSFAPEAARPAPGVAPNVVTPGHPVPNGPGARPAEIHVPEAVHPASIPHSAAGPQTPPPAGPPNALKPEASHPTPVQQAAPHPPLPNVIRSEASRPAPVPVQRPATPVTAPHETAHVPQPEAAPHPEAARRPEPQHQEAQHQEPQHAAAPPPHPAEARRPEPQEHKKAPNER